MLSEAKYTTARNLSSNLCISFDKTLSTLYFLFVSPIRVDEGHQVEVVLVEHVEVRARVLKQPVRDVGHRRRTDPLPKSFE